MSPNLKLINGLLKTNSLKMVRTIKEGKIMAQKLTGKSAVVTGGGSEMGIGKEVALAMATEGAQVVVNDITKDPDGTWGADRVVREIKKAKGSAVANYDSVTTMSGGENIIKTATSNFGRVDILVNCAGNFIARPTVDYTEDEWDSTIAIHLKGLFSCTRAAIIEMIKQKSGGRIINITSVGAFPPNLGPGPATAYATAKAGVLGFTKMLSLEMEEHGITVNAISPNAVTGLFPFREMFGAQRYGPEFVAPIIVFLATDEAKNITGQFIYSGGGDIAIFDQPMQMPEPPRFTQKTGKWTVDELIKIIPPLIR
jgi:NAD(P)-dependent dehydrogenase (short-subunit alcohol dehydrogenase family)